MKHEKKKESKGKNVMQAETKQKKGGAKGGAFAIESKGKGLSSSKSPVEKY